MTKWHKKLPLKYDEQQIVRVDRSPVSWDEIEGYVVGVSKLFVMLHALEPDSMTLNGYIVLRNKHIRRYRIKNEGDSFIDRALKLKGIHPIVPPEIDLSSYSSLLCSANTHFPLVTIHQEKLDAEICFIGRVQKLTEKTVKLEEISPAAQWERTRRYKFKDITRIDFGGGYEDALALGSAHEAQEQTATA